MRPDPRHESFYAGRSVHEVARDLVGCVIRHGDAAGRVVEVESYHQEEPACHAYSGLTERTRVLFGPPGNAYVYRSYGVHALLNAVSEPDGVGAAALIRALEPVDGIDLMRERPDPAPIPPEVAERPLIQDDAYWPVAAPGVPPPPPP